MYFEFGLDKEGCVENCELYMIRFETSYFNCRDVFNLKLFGKLCFGKHWRTFWKKRFSGVILGLFSFIKMNCFALSTCLTLGFGLQLPSLTCIPPDLILTGWISWFLQLPFVFWWILWNLEITIYGSFQLCRSEAMLKLTYWSVCKSRT